MKRIAEMRLAYLRPGQIARRLSRASVVYVPFGPLEWHGPHLPYGTDPLNAEAAALAVCGKAGGVVWPTQFWGTERERSAAQLASLGFPRDRYVVGMDFPKNLINSSYCPEEVFAVVVREILREITSLGAKLAVLVNGHGAENHMAVLKRLETEFNNRTQLRVYFRMAAPKAMMNAGSGGHADCGETSLLMHLHPDCVDLSQLPPKSRRMKYTDYAVVDGPGFDGTGDGYLSKEADPRFRASAKTGRGGSRQTVREIAAEVAELLATLKSR